MVLIECENNLVGIFAMVIAIVFEHAPAENCRRDRLTDPHKNKATDRQKMTHWTSHQKHRHPQFK
jgi:hypothetical protein